MTVERTVAFARDAVVYGRIHDNVEAGGTSSTDATPLKGNRCRVVSVAAGGGARLLAASAGMEMLVALAGDRADRNDCLLYPAPGDFTGAGEFVILDGRQASAAWLYCFTEGIWEVAASHGTLIFPVISGLFGAGALAASSLQWQSAGKALAGTGALAAALIQRQLASAAHAGSGILGADASVA